MNQTVRKRLWLAAWTVLLSTPLLAMMVAPVAARGGAAWETGIALGFAALTLLVLQFLLTSRMRWLTAPFGVDLVIYFHRYLALTLIVVVMVHPLLLFSARPVLLENGATLLTTWPMLSGIVSLGLMMLLTISSLWRKRLGLPYNHWRILHLALALGIIGLAFVHMYGIGYYSDAAVLQILWTLIALSVALVVLTVRLLRPWRLLRRPWRVDDITPGQGDAWTLTLRPDGHKGLHFRSGQFAWLSLNHSPFVMQEHPFSIASAPHRDKPELRFAIKELGDFTRTIGTLQPGDRAYVDGPYGVFSHEYHSGATGFVFVAGGIGVAPMLAMLEDLARRGDDRQHYLITAHSSIDRVPCDHALRAASARLTLTRITMLEQLPDDSATAPDANETILEGWLTRDILERHLPDNRGDYHYFLCGPLPMLRVVEQSLRRLGVPGRNVHTELFDMA